MSRHGYTDDGENWSFICWRGQVASAIRGKRGQRLIKDLVTALEALPVKELASHDIINSEGCPCGLGAALQHRGIIPKEIKRVSVGSDDDYDYDYVSGVLSEALDIAPQLAREIMFINDDDWHSDDAGRYRAVLSWAKDNLREAK